MELWLDQGSCRIYRVSIDGYVGLCQTSETKTSSTMAERILRAYFTEGQDIGDVETSVNLAADVGIDAEQAKAFLLSDEGIEEVKELKKQAICALLLRTMLTQTQQRFAIAQNIHSVPTIRIGKEILVGAQRVDVLLATLQNAVNELEVA